MLKIALIDDDAACRTEMERLCCEFAAENGYIAVALHFPSAEAFFKTETDDFSLVFMDIYMEDMDGIAAARLLRQTNERCLLVFLTSSGEHMPAAFRCHAFDYLVKPVNAARVFTVLRDAVSVLGQGERRIEIPVGRQTLRLLPDDILSVVSDGHYLNICLSGGQTVRPRMTVSEFLALTAGDARFLMANKGIVLNIDAIAEIENECCILYNGAYFPIRVRDRVHIKQAVQDYRFEAIRRRQFRGKGGA